MAASTVTAMATAHHKPWYRHLYVQVLCAIVLGVLLGHFYPDLGASMKPLGDAFIKLIKMLIAPIIFCTVVHGIASMEDMKKVGRVGVKALIYFEVMTTIALIIGLVVVNVWQPGAGMNVDPAALDTNGDRHLHAEGRRAEHARLLPAHHPGHGGRRLRRGRDPAGPVLRHPVRLRAALAGRARQAAAAHHRPDRARLLRHRRHHHEGWRRSAPSAPWPSPSASTASSTLLSLGSLMARLLRHLPDLRLRRARRRLLALRLQHLQVHPLHQGGAADRARHQLLRSRCCRGCWPRWRTWAPTSRWSGWSSRPATPSTSTAPASISPWRRCSWPRPPTPT